MEKHIKSIKGGENILNIKVIRLVGCGDFVKIKQEINDGLLKNVLVFFDEAQCLTEKYVEIMFSLKGFFAFCDRNQVFDRSHDFIGLIEGGAHQYEAKVKKYELEEGFRCPKGVMDFAKILLDARNKEAKKDGKKNNVVIYLPIQMIKMMLVWV